jgi:ribosomal L30p/L7e-like protein
MATSADLPDTPATRGMIRKVQHLVRVVGGREVTGWSWPDSAIAKHDDKDVGR